MAACFSPFPQIITDKSCEALLITLSNESFSQQSSSLTIDSLQKPIGLGHGPIEMATPLAMAAFCPPLCQIRIDLARKIWVVQLGAQLAEHGLCDLHPHLEVIFPPEVGQIVFWAFVQRVKVVSQCFGVSKVLCVDVGVGRCHLGIPGLAQDYGKDGLRHAKEKLLRHILITKGVLEGEIELVVALDSRRAVVDRAPAVGVAFTATVAINVHLKARVPNTFKLKLSLD